jgi:hypothetical protein
MVFKSWLLGHQLCLAVLENVPCCCCKLQQRQVTVILHQSVRGQQCHWNRLCSYVAELCNNVAVSCTTAEQCWLQQQCHSVC